MTNTKTSGPPALRRTGPTASAARAARSYYHPPTGGKEVEIWNLVFTQFNRVGDPPDNLRPLPKKNIDTGMGLERTAAVLQGVESNFEIDILRPLCEAAGDVVGVRYDYKGKQGRPLRRIADHIRACTFAIHEGVAPDSKDAAYIIRLLLAAGVPRRLPARQAGAVPASVGAACDCRDEGSLPGTFTNREKRGRNDQRGRGSLPGNNRSRVVEVRPTRREGPVGRRHIAAGQGSLRPASDRWVYSRSHQGTRCRSWIHSRSRWLQTCRG